MSPIELSWTAKKKDKDKDKSKDTPDDKIRLERGNQSAQDSGLVPRQ